MIDFEEAYIRVCNKHDAVRDENDALRASNAQLREALEVAKEAMDERRSYVNNGDPSTCWQEMKYGAAWDAEDELVRAALVVKP